MANPGESGWDILTRRCEARGLRGEAMFEEILRTMTAPRIKGELPPLPPVRQGPPQPDEVEHYPVSEPEFVELAVAGGPRKLWQIVRYDEPDLAFVRAAIYLNGFSLVWDDAGFPAEFSDGEPVTADTKDLVILGDPGVFGGVFVCRADRPDAVATIRHDQLVIQPRE